MLDTAALLGIGGVAVALLLIAGQFDLSIGVVAVASSLVTALLIEQAGWDTWPALLVSLGRRPAGRAGQRLPGREHRAAQLPGDAGDLPGPAGHVAGRRRGARRLRAGDRPGRRAAAGRRPTPSSARPCSSATAGSGSRCSGGWGSPRWPPGRCGAPGSATPSSPAAAPAGPPASWASRSARTTLTLFCLTAAAGWLIGTLGLVRLGGVQVRRARAWPRAVDFIVVAVIGGCLLTGGYGSTVGAAIGALLYAVAREGIALAGWDPPWFQALPRRPAAASRCWPTASCATG